MTTVISSRRFPLKPSRSTSSSGFILVAVIWVLAAVSLLVGFIATQLEDLQNQAFNREQLQQERFDQLAVESTFLYLAATRGYSHAGLRSRVVESPAETNAFFATNHFADRGDEIRMDGRDYLVRGGQILSVQDAGSLVSLRSDRLTNLKRLLASYNLDPRDINRMVTVLADYIDRDELTRIDGAERNEYDSSGLLPPTNRFLASPFQLKNLLGWREFLDRHPGVFDEITIYVADRENYNTMTERAIGLISEVDSADAERIFEHRKTDSFSNLSEVLQVTGNVFQRDPFTVTNIPSRYMRVRLYNPRSGIEAWIGITLTPASSFAPWEVDYRHLLAMEGKADANSAMAAPTTLLR